MRIPHITVLAVVLAALVCSGARAAETAGSANPVEKGKDVPMASSVSLRAFFINGSPDYVPAVLAGRSVVSLDVEMDAAKPVPAKAKWHIRARDLFTDSEVTCERPLGAVPSGKQRLQLDLTPKELPLTPGCWHLLVDVQADGKSLAGLDKGSTVVYARKEDESFAHCHASFNLARVAFAWDKQYKIYFKGYRSEIPPTGDPFDDANTERFRSEYITDQMMAPELMHDGGLGFLQAAIVYRALGEKDRAAYCEKVLRRTADAIRNLMYGGDGKLYYVKSVAEKRAHHWHARTEDGFALKFLCQTYFYFRFGPGEDPDYARELLKFAKPMYDYTSHETLELGCGRECKVYDGRILSGMAWYALAHKAEYGSYPENIRTVVDTARSFSQNLLSHQGWYDDGCYVEGECHIWCGNLNVLNGLLPSLRIVRDLPDYNTQPQIQRGVTEAFRFLTQTNGVVTGRANFVPTLTAQWAVGNMYELCDEYLRQVGQDGGVRTLMEELSWKTGIVNNFHRNNNSGALLLGCPEYLSLKEKPLLPWDRNGRR